jgi:hypothetical protein
MDGNQTTLDERNLVNGMGVGDYLPRASDKIIFNNTENKVKKQVTGSSCVNWNPDLECGDMDPIEDDLNTIKTSDGYLLCSEEELTLLQGFADWENIAYDMRGSGGFDNGAPGSNGRTEPSHKCIQINSHVPSHSPAAHKFRECSGGAGVGTNEKVSASGEITYEDLKSIRILVLDQFESYLESLKENSFNSASKKQQVINDLSPEFNNAKKKIRNNDLSGSLENLANIRKSLDGELVGPNKDLAKAETTAIINGFVKVLNIQDPTIDKKVLNIQDHMLEKLYPPGKQKKLEVMYDKIKCNRGLTLMVSDSLKDAICVRETTAKQIIDRGWQDYKPVG